MENTPPATETRLNSGKRGGVNLTVIIVAVVLCATLLGALAILKNKPETKTVSAQTEVAPKPEVPAFITWRETKMPGQTQVARIWAKTDGQFPMRVWVQVESSVSGSKKVKEVVLERSNVERPLELGFLEGHTFVPGDKVSVGHQDYSPTSSTCKPLK
jgi:hypothetical protein